MPTAFEERLWFLMDFPHAAYRDQLCANVTDASSSCRKCWDTYASEPHTFTHIACHRQPAFSWNWARFPGHEPAGAEGTVDLRTLVQAQAQVQKEQNIAKQYRASISPETCFQQPIASKGAFDAWTGKVSIGEQYQVAKVNMPCEGRSIWP